MTRKIDQNRLKTEKMKNLKNLKKFKKKKFTEFTEFTIHYSLKIFTEDIEYMNCQLFVKCQKVKHLNY